MAILNWTQKWGVSGLALYWDNSWAEGHPLGNLQLDAVGHFGLSQTGFITLISKELGDLALDLVGHQTIAGNLTNVLPTELSLGNLTLPMVGHKTILGNLGSVDPFWIDPPITMAATGHLGFPGVVNIQQVLAQPLGNPTLPAVGRMAFGPVTIGTSVTKELGALSLNMIAGIDLTANLNSHFGDAFVLDVTSFAMYGRTTIAGDARPLLPPHQIGPATMDMTGHATTTVVTLFSGGPFSLGDIVLPMVGRSQIRFDLSYPPFDAGSGIEAVIDPSVGNVVARVDPDNLSVQ